MQSTKQGREQGGFGVEQRACARRPHLRLAAQGRFNGAEA